MINLENILYSSALQPILLYVMCSKVISAEAKI